jgi:hypothetical protein
MMQPDAERENAIIQAFAMTYASLKNGIGYGTMAPRDQMALVDAMARMMKDYIELQRSYVGAIAAIEKAKQ